MDAPARAFLDAQLGDASPEALACALSDADHPDHDTVLDYLCTPEASLRHAVEALLMAHPASPGAPLAGLVEALLCGFGQGEGGLAPCTGCRLGVRMEGRDIAAPLLPDWAIASLVSRLRLDTGPDDDTAAVMASVLSGGQLVTARVLVRQARIAATPFHAALLRLFFRAVPQTAPDSGEALCLWLDVLEDLKPEDDAVACLRRRRDRLARAARDADAFFTQLARYNMETMMLQGMSAPALDGDEARRRVRLLDRLCLALFGVAAGEVWGSASVERDLGSFDAEAGGESVAALFRHLCPGGTE